MHFIYSHRFKIRNVLKTVLTMRRMLVNVCKMLLSINQVYAKYFVLSDRLRGTSSPHTRPSGVYIAGRCAPPVGSAGAARAPRTAPWSCPANPDPVERGGLRPKSTQSVCAPGKHNIFQSFDFIIRIYVQRAPQYPTRSISPDPKRNIMVACKGVFGSS